MKRILRGVRVRNQPTQRIPHRRSVIAAVANDSTTVNEIKDHPESSKPNDHVQQSQHPDSLQNSLHDESSTPSKLITILWEAFKGPDRNSESRQKLTTATNENQNQNLNLKNNTVSKDQIQDQSNDEQNTKAKNNSENQENELEKSSATNISKSQEDLVQEEPKAENISKSQENSKDQKNSNPPLNPEPKENSTVQVNLIAKDQSNNKDTSRSQNLNSKQTSISKTNSNSPTSSKGKQISIPPQHSNSPQNSKSPHNSKTPQPQNTKKPKPKNSKAPQPQNSKTPQPQNSKTQQNSNTQQNSKAKNQSPDNSKTKTQPKTQDNSNKNSNVKQNSNSIQTSNAQTNSKGNQNSNSQQHSKTPQNSKAKDNQKTPETPKPKQNSVAQGNPPTKESTEPPNKANNTSQIIKSLEPLVPPTSKGKTRTLTQTDLTKFDRFVTIGPPPSQNPPLYTRKIAKFILDSRLRFPDAILLTCVGSFYEAYFDQAVEVAELLNIKQAKYQFAGHSYPFAGFPISSLERHLKTLVNEHNRVVAIAEQISTSEDLERKIVRIITPGTITDESLIDIESHNYLLAIHRNELAWLDVSTGSYFRTVVDGDENKLMDQICRIAPKEIIISADSSFSIPEDSKAAKLSILITNIENSGDFIHSPEDLTAEKLIGFYIKRNHLPSQTATKPSYITALRYLELDTEAIDSLELVRTQNGRSTAGSLLTTVSRTITAPGKRLLRDRIISPSRVLSEIETRLDMVEKLVKNHIPREDIQDGLDRIKETDYIRLLQRFVLRQGTVNDLISMIRVLQTIRSISSTLKKISLPSPLGTSFNLEDRISDVMRGCHLAGKAKSEDLSIVEVNDFFFPIAWNVRPDFTEELSSLHQELKTAMESGKNLQDQYRAHLGLNDLSLQLAPRLGAVISISKSRASTTNLKEKLGSLNGQKLVENGSRVLFATPKWTKLHGLIENCKQKLIDAEERVLQSLYEEIASEHITLNRLFENLAELDVAQSFATFAVETNCVRPSISLEKSTTIVNGRHPIAARALNLNANGNFIPNSTTMNENDGLIQIITGPNNGGKSTYLRQVAIIHILAQAGGFVPASQAKLGIVHHIFTRFGSFDNVLLGKGTFLIEMEETCKILKSADKMSLVLIDEVGRGTGIEDGLSIAYGVIKYLLDKINCRTLFSTHLPHLGPLLLNKISPIKNNNNSDRHEGITQEDYLKIDKLGFFCFRSSKVEKSDQNQGKRTTGSKEVEVTQKAEEVELRFSHRVERGLNGDSSGIDIAKMVGLPKEVIKNSLFIREPDEYG